MFPHVPAVTEHADRRVSSASRSRPVGGRFILASILAHAGVLAVLPGQPDAGAPAPRLLVEIRPAPTPMPMPRTEVDKPPPPAKTPRPRPAQKTTPPAEPSAAPAIAPAGPMPDPPSIVANQVATAVTEPAAHIPPPPAAVAAPSATVAISSPPVVEKRGKPPTRWLAEYTQSLTGQVSRVRQYPPIARLRGWQGTTVLALQIGPGGAILDARVAESSGHEVLDRQAIDMIRRAEPLPPFPADADASLHVPLHVRLPIVFALAARD